MPHVENTGNVGRRYYYGKGLPVIRGTVKVSFVQPVLVPSFFNLLWLKVLGKRSAHA
jgi:hypothetical protein